MNNHNILQLIAFGAILVLGAEAEANSSESSREYEIKQALYNAIIVHSAEDWEDCAASFLYLANQMIAMKESAETMNHFAQISIFASDTRAEWDGADGIADKRRFIGVDENTGEITVNIDELRNWGAERFSQFDSRASYVKTYQDKCLDQTTAVGTAVEAIDKFTR